MSRILSLQAENFKRLVAVEIRPDGNVVVLSGKNRQGKTSVLDAMLAALRGARFSRETSQTIRDGEDHAWVRVEIGDDPQHIQYVATRRWTKEDAGTLTVESADGAKYSSPQKLLDDITGDISFDPMLFIELDAKKQAEALVKALGTSLPFDPMELAARRKGVYDARTDAGRDVAKYEGQLAGLPDIDPSLPAEELSISALLAEADLISKHNDAITRLEDQATYSTNERAVAQEVLARAREAVESAEEKLEQAQRVERARQAAFAASERLDLNAVTEKIAGAEQTNARIREQRRRVAIDEDVRNAKKKVAQFTIALIELDKFKADGIAQAKFPVSELSFNDDGVTYAGRAFTQASTEEQMRAAFGVAIASNPKLRVCRIDKGEALDSESFATLAALAAEFDVQLWVTKVTDGEKVGFVVEDGSVVAA